jgi:hypothetical protein
VGKSCICQDLEYLAEQSDARSDPKITVSRLRRSTSVAIIGGKRVTVQRQRDPFFTVAIFIELMIAVLVKPPDAKHPHSTRENAMMRALVLGAAALALLVGAASAQTVYPGYDGYTATAPLYDYAAPASSAPVDAAPHGYGPLVYEAQVYTPTPAYPAPPTTPGYYTALPAVASQPSYDYAPGYWGR